MRTSIDFSKHILTVTKRPEVVIYDFSKPGTVINSLKFINCSGILSVTGDFGNWIFCREFHPSAKEGVSSAYWYEKLCLYSTQDGKKFSEKDTILALEEKIEEYKFQNSDLDLREDIYLEYYNECIEKAKEHELDYTYFAYREKPGNLDYEDVVFIKDYHFWLKVVFDAFDEMCNLYASKPETIIYV